MAIQTRYAGDANGINNVDAKYDGTLGTIIATGLTKNPTALKITGFGTFTAAESATGGAVETILRLIGVNATLLAYQVNQSIISVAVENSDWNASSNTDPYNSTITTGLQCCTSRLYR